MATSNKLKLRLNGYSVTEAGHILCDRGRQWDHERCGVLQVNLSADTPAARAIADAIVAAIDEPRALRGRSKSGSAVVLFRVDRGNSNQSRELALLTGEGVSLISGCDGLTVNPAQFTWSNRRTPFNVARDALPPLQNEYFETAFNIAYKLGARVAADLEHERAAAARLEITRAEIAAGFWTDEAIQQRADDALVARFEGQVLGHVDSMYADVRAARLRAAHRKRVAEAAAASTAA